MLVKEIKKRALPSLKSQEEMLDIMLSQEYGFLPKKPKEVTYEKESLVGCFCAGKADLEMITASFKINGRDFSFPFTHQSPR